MATLYPWMNSPTLGCMVALVVGPDRPWSQKLAKSMVDYNRGQVPQLQVRTAIELPLPSANSDHRPKIDFIIFVVDMSSHNLDALRNALLKVDLSYFIGKSCFVARQAAAAHASCLGVDTLSKLAKSFASPAFFTNFEDDEGLATIGRQLHCLTKVASGHQPGTSALELLNTRTLLASDF